MCMIVDANAVHHLTNRTQSGKPVLAWLLRGDRAGLVVGGKNFDEVAIASFKETLTVLKQAGRLHRVDAPIIAKFEERIKKEKLCKSNDSHIVALALASKCRLVFTGDGKLHADLKTNSPAGEKISIYQNSSHHHLLIPCKCFQVPVED